MSRITYVSLGAMACALFFLCPLSVAQDLEIYCIEVGLDSSGFYHQGDSTLIISPTGTTLLIDGGAAGDSGANSVLALLGRVIPDGGLDYIITTHWDGDHSGGLADIATYNADQYMPTTVYDLGDSATKAPASYNNAFNGIQETPAVGEEIDLGGGCKVVFVTVDGHYLGGGYDAPGSDANARAIGVLIQHDCGFDYLSLGDLPDDWENELGTALQASDINIDVLHVSHHGSYNSTANGFVSSILPEYAVISCGDNNGYGHPHQYVINRLNALTNGGAAYDPEYAAVNTIYTLERGDPDAGTAANVTIVGNGHDTDPTLQGSLKITVSEGEDGSCEYSFENEGPNTNTIDDGPYDVDDCCCDPDFGDYAKWPMFRYNAKRTGAAIDAGPALYTLKWTFNLGADVSSSPAVSFENDVYVGAENNILYCLTSAGAIRWTYSTAGLISSSPAIDDSRVYVGSDDYRLYALSSLGGALAWSYLTGAAISSSPAVTASRVYVGSDDDRLYAFSVTGGLVWSYRMADDIDSSPAVSGNTLYVGSKDNYVLGLWNTGTFFWSYRTAGDVSASPCLSATNLVYVGSGDSRFYALDFVGRLYWSYRTGDSIASSAAIGCDVSAEVVYVGSNDDHVYAFDYEGGRVWSYATAGDVSSSPAIGATGLVFVGSGDNVLYSFVSTGALFWTFNTTEPVTSSVAIGSGTVYIGSDSNKLYAF